MEDFDKRERSLLGDEFLEIDTKIEDVIPTKGVVAASSPRSGKTHSRITIPSQIMAEKQKHSHS